MWVDVLFFGFLSLCDLHGVGSCVLFGRLGLIVCGWLVCDLGVS